MKFEVLKGSLNIYEVLSERLFPQAYPGRAPSLTVDTWTGSSHSSVLSLSVDHGISRSCPPLEFFYPSSRFTQGPKFPSRYCFPSSRLPCFFLLLVHRRFSFVFPRFPALQSGEGPVRPPRVRVRPPTLQGPTWITIGTFLFITRRTLSVMAFNLQANHILALSQNQRGGAV